MENAVRKLDLQKDTVFYIFDMGARTGGGEALYQLRLDLEDMGYSAYILYYQDDLSTLVLPEKFQKYFRGERKICTRKDVVDEEKNCIIVPEAATTCLFDYPRMQKVVWWLSIQNYDGAFQQREPRHPGKLDPLKKVLHRLEYKKLELARLRQYHKTHFPLEQVQVHLAGSYYVLETLEQRYHITPATLIHSIGVDFLKMGEWTREQDTQPREDIVLYNPAKPFKQLHTLLEHKKFRYVPICNMTPPEMIALFRRSKLYIDFGLFPGPERLPKETSYNGTLVLVGKRNAAVNPYDVMIPEEYKLSPKASPEEIEAKIGDMLARYEEIYHDFDAFRQMVSAMEETYYQQMQEIFSCK